jgi:hypothetical protein
MGEDGNEVDGDAHGRSAVNGGEREMSTGSGAGRRDRDWRGLGHRVAHGGRD